jgi:hypothetical protein
MLTRAGLVLAALLQSTVALAAITFIGEGSISRNHRRQSGLKGILEDGVTPANQVGGLGSAITYSGIGDFYLGTPDRGPADGTTSYVDRIYTIQISVTKTSMPATCRGSRLRTSTGSAGDASPGGGSERAARRVSRYERARRARPYAMAAAVTSTHPHTKTSPKRV